MGSATNEKENAIRQPTPSSSPTSRPFERRLQRHPLRSLRLFIRIYLSIHSSTYISAFLPAAFPLPRPVCLALEKLVRVHKNLLLSSEYLLSVCHCNAELLGKQSMSFKNLFPGFQNLLSAISGNSRFAFGNDNGFSKPRMGQKTTHRLLLLRPNIMTEGKVYTHSI